MPNRLTQKIRFLAPSSSLHHCFPEVPLCGYGRLGTSCSSNGFCTFTLLCISSLLVSNSSPNIQLKYYPNSVDKSLICHLCVQSSFYKISYDTVYLPSWWLRWSRVYLAVWETLGSTLREDPEEGMDTHSRILAWTIPWVRHDWVTFTHSHVSITCLHSASLVKMFSKGHTMLIPSLYQKFYLTLASIGSDK